MRINQELIKLFKQICIFDEDDLSDFLTKTLKSYYNNVIQTNDYILAQGDIPIALCAHMDTVGIAPPSHIFYDEEANVMWSPELLGADDRAGVFAILWLVFSGLKPTIILTQDEEVGGLGAKALVRDYPKSPFGNLKAIIEIDRQGSKDAVYYFCNNPDFEKYISSFGFKTAYGSFSDISIIAPAWGCAAVNLSAGYYNEHFVNEFVNLAELMCTVTKVKNILLQEESMSYFEYIPFERNYRSFAPLQRKSGLVCEICTKKFGKGDKKMSAYGMTICEDCYNEYLV